MSPEAPEWLSDRAKDVWRRTAAEVPAGADPEAFAVYCCAVADWTEAQQTLDRTGLVIRGANGNLVRSPFNQIKQANAQAVAALARDLGIGPDASVPAPRGRYRNQAALERTLSWMKHHGRLEPIDDALIAVARTLAQQLDDEPSSQNAWAYLATIKSLRGAVGDDSDRGLADVIAAMSAQMGDAPES